MINEIAIGIKIKKLRKNKRLSLETLAGKMHISRQTLSDCEKGTLKITAGDLMNLCNLLGCDYGYLLGYHDTLRHTATDVQKVTGLSELAIEKIKFMNECNKWKWGINTLSKIIECDEFEALVGLITDFAFEDENAKVSGFDADDFQEVSQLRITDVRALYTQNAFQKIIEQVREHLYKYSPHNKAYMKDEIYERVSFQLIQYQFAYNCYENNYLTEDEFNEVIRLIDVENYDGCGKIW